MTLFLYKSENKRSYLSCLDNCWKGSTTNNKTFTSRARKRSRQTFVNKGWTVTEKRIESCFSLSSLSPFFERLFYDDFLCYVVLYVIPNKRKVIKIVFLFVIENNNLRLIILLILSCNYFSPKKDKFYINLLDNIAIN